jgi:MraZ protein
LSGRRVGDRFHVQEADRMFNGEYNHTLDTKGRLIIPTRFRDDLGEELKVTRGLDGCLFAFPLGEWETFEEKLRSLPLTQSNARRFTRFFVAGAMNCELDRQGRILLPQSLREFAGLDKDVVVTGMINRVEIWDKQRWTDYNASGNMDDIAEQMSELGLNI